jgi:hypothetical protein
MMWDHYHDPEHCSAAPVLYDDIRRLHSIGLGRARLLPSRRRLVPREGEAPAEPLRHWLEAAAIARERQPAPQSALDVYPFTHTV